ncbi:hypothetical protein DFQ27_003266 [Actinomortierella ambigua]|uniref:Uncharacterized protein n=1 Tax=Actinomortierella ambigua TaxID=1343610 RepID=A0A9P6U5T4_9FUNG|nr:hypothetical protein DFQ27_003266 [Actinomortierella ambigua]
MNRANSSSSLPFHSSGSRKTSVQSLAITVKRMGLVRLCALVGICIASLLVISRAFRHETVLNNNDRVEHSLQEHEREETVRHILNTRRSQYLFEDFSDEAFGNEHLIATTAILLSWKRVEGLKTIVRYLARYPYIKEIIIWNNNKENHLTKADFAMTDDDMAAFNGGNGAALPEIKVVNAQENLHDLAKYMSCSLASYSYCYFQDDDWLNTHMDALYTNFLTSPNLIHTNTLPLIHMEHRRWTFTNEAVKMHAGFSWMGTGSFLPRAKARQLLQQGGNSNLAKDRLRVIDMYFSIWTNQYPYQLVNYLTPLDQANSWSEDGVDDHWKIVFGNMLDAANRLYDALFANPEVSEKDYFAREEELPPMKDRHDRAPCHNDKCLFMTSLDPFPLPSEVKFERDLTEITQQDTRFQALQYPTNKFWEEKAYIHAVDNDPRTCWNSFKTPQIGDSIGLRFVVPTAVKQLKVASSRSIAGMGNQISVYVSDRVGYEWVKCQHTTRYPFAHSMLLDLNCPTSPLLSKGLVNIVKIQFEAAQEKSLDVCGFEVAGMTL